MAVALDEGGDREDLGLVAEAVSGRLLGQDGNARVEARERHAGAEEGAGDEGAVHELATPAHERGLHDEDVEGEVRRLDEADDGVVATAEVSRAAVLEDEVGVTGRAEHDRSLANWGRAGMGRSCMHVVGNIVA